MPPPPDPTPADRKAAVYVSEWTPATDYPPSGSGYIAEAAHMAAVEAAYRAGLAAGRATERERCARVAESVGHETTRQVGDGFPGAPGIWSIYREIAAAIRRGPA